jgi:hypothetical protein
MPAPSTVPRGRGAVSNAAGRFESRQSEAFVDGWTGDDAAPTPLRTVIQPERAKTIISRNDSPDVGFDRSINPYRGCEHGCIYWSVTHLRNRPCANVRYPGGRLSFAWSIGHSFSHTSSPSSSLNADWSARLICSASERRA